MPDTRLDAVGELIKAERNKRARELALKYRLSHYVYEATTALAAKMNPMKERSLQF